jgi:hypothetical protein
MTTKLKTRKAWDELSTFLHRMRGLLDMVKSEIAGHEDGDDDDVLAVIDVLEADLETVLTIVLNKEAA